jgi:HTH-type transcriptional regulator/antitoxin HipB
MDYPVQITSQLQQLLKSLRKSHQMTQADLARALGVVQSRVADIERDPGAVSVGAHVVVRDNRPDAREVSPGVEVQEPRGQW